MSRINQMESEIRAVPQLALDLGTIHHFSAGVYAKQMFLPEGAAAVTHAHKYDHMSILASGEVIVATDDQETLYTAPAVIDIKAGVKHGIIALKDSVWFCVHATDEIDPSKVDEVLIEQP